MLRNLEHEARAVVLDLERVQDGGEAIVELHVDDGTDDGADLADTLLGRRRSRVEADCVLSVSTLALPARVPPPLANDLGSACGGEKDSGAAREKEGDASATPGARRAARHGAGSRAVPLQRPRP